MIFCAASASFQREGSSTLAFSSARRRVDVSTSKMPPQQSHGLLDGFDQRFGFRAHDHELRWKRRAVRARLDEAGNIGAGPGGVNR
jgi:hypothetical protein